jgi:hypothetical protein
MTIIEMLKSLEDGEQITFHKDAYGGLAVELHKPLDAYRACRPQMSFTKECIAQECVDSDVGSTLGRHLEMMREFVTTELAKGKRGKRKAVAKSPRP